MMSSSKNPISLLQEEAIRNFNQRPDYIYDKLETNEFKCTVILNNLSREVVAGRKQIAKTLAAEAMLQALGILPKKNQVDWHSKLGQTSKLEFCPTLHNTSSYQSSNSNKDGGFKNIHGTSHFSDKDILSSTQVNYLNSENKVSCTQNIKDTVDNPVSLLYQTLAEYKVVPEFKELDTIKDDDSSLIHYIEVTGLGINVISGGTSKKEAKANASFELLAKLGLSCKQETKYSKDNAVGQLLTFCQTNHVINKPIYEWVKCEGKPHSMMFTIRCTVDKIIVERSATTKKAAKNLSAEAALGLLKKQFDTFSIEKITFNSQLDNKEEVNQRAWQRLKETRARNNIKLVSSFDKLPLDDYLYLFENNYYGKSKTLDNLKSDRLKSQTINPYYIFKNVTEELNIKYDLFVLECKKGCLLNLFLKCEPHWSFIVAGEHMHTAKAAIFTKALEFFCSM